MSKSMRNLVLLICTILFFTPVVWTVINSLRSIYSSPTLFPKSFHPENYKMALTIIDFWRYALNSTIISTISVILLSSSSALVGFAFARLKAPGKQGIFVFILSTIMLPPIVTQVPTYVVFSRIGLIDTFWPWVFWGLGGNAFFIFLYRQFFSSIPKDLEDAARIDGCSIFRIFWNIFVPVSVPVIATVAVMSFQNAWGDFLTPFMFLNERHYPLAIALVNKSYTLPGSPDVPLEPVISAAAILFSIPILISFFIGQKFMKEGFISSGVKG